MIGDEDNMLARQRSLIPAGWFADAAPFRDAVLGGIGTSLSWIYGFVGYAKAQTRITTATGFILDLVAWDFFGSRFMRRANETDDSWRPRILKEIFRPRVTRAAISGALFDLTGKRPEIYEPWNSGDCGAYDVGTVAYSGSGSGGAPVAGYDLGPGGYDVGGSAYTLPNSDTGSSAGAGCYGSYELPNQIFVRVHPGSPVFDHPEGIGGYDTPTFAYGGDGGALPAFPGYDSPIAGLDLGPAAYLDPPGVSYGNFAGVGYLGGANTEGSITDAEIYATIAQTVAAGVTAWTEILPN